MIKRKSLGIWMDHASAHLIELTDPIITPVITLNFTNDEKELSWEKSENLMHNKEQAQQADYYKKLGETIRHFDDVLLFGSTDAKLELSNRLKSDFAFSKIKIETNLQKECPKTRSLLL